jgi:hypothetical protein
MGNLQFGIQTVKQLLLQTYEEQIRENVITFLQWEKTKKKTKLHGLSPRANYTDRATAPCRLSDC